jgi:NAD(P)-dependent dehydrogenase (short-subunit alcohol dehydrogenase family)
MRDFHGRTAFITGAASGIGLGMAQAFAAEGMKLALADIDADRLAEATKPLIDQGTEVLTLALDVADRGAWADAAARAEAVLGPIALLCNNAGVSAPGRNIGDVDGAFWDRCVGINLTGVFNGCSVFVPRMRECGRDGHIVNTASMSGLIATAGQAVYNATKFAVVALSETLAQELAPAGIGVSVLCPGPVRSLLWRSSRAAQGLPDIDTPPPQALAGGSAAPHALDPAMVGRLVVAAIKAQQLHVLTHPERWPLVADRSARLEASFRWSEAILTEGV